MVPSDLPCGEHRPPHEGPGVLLHLCEVRVDGVDDELVLGGTWGSHGT